jgi:[acyl-carrier-protein] S-malonyltransferase
MSKLVFVFPGQGAQEVGMGKDLYENHPIAKEILLQCAPDILTLLTLCFNGPKETLTETHNTQPAMFAVSVAAFEAVKALGIIPAVVAGHSVGEYAALYAAGVFDVPTGFALVQARGKAMTEAAQLQPGKMAAVLGLETAIVAEVCVNVPGIVVPANDNSPGQVVISGESAAVDSAAVLLKEKGAKRVVPLAVSGAFHSPLMQPAAETMRAKLQTATLAAPQIPIIANVTADYETTADQVRENLVHQVAGPVRWVETIQRLTADGYTTYIECGVGTALAGLIKRIDPNAIVYSVGDSTGLARLKEGLQL